MSATLLIISLISGGAIAFFVRFLIALHKESRGPQIERPTMKSRIGRTSEYRIPYRQANAIVRVEYKIEGTRGPQGPFFYYGAGKRPDISRLTPTQNLVALGVILPSDSSFLD